MSSVHPSSTTPSASTTPATPTTVPPSSPTGEHDYGSARPSDDTLARAALTYCTDSADALMFATLKGAPDAWSVLSAMYSSASWMPERMQWQRPMAASRLEEWFVTGAAQWGLRADSRALTTFRKSLEGWQTRLHDLLTSLAVIHHDFGVEEMPWYDRHDNGEDDCCPMPQTLAEAIWSHATVDGRYWLIGPDSTLWPEQVGDLCVRKDWAAPLCLWGLGHAPALKACDRPLAIVGSRGVNEYGRTVAYSLGRHAAGDGHTVVSGGAMGADAAAHWGAIRAREQYGDSAGSTIAVFAGGLTHIGPRSNQLLFDAIVANKGALISESFPGTVPQPHRFLLRNRIIAALASTVVVAQARRRSGALNTATWASELNRDIYAAPGDITTPSNGGCNRLIADGKAMLLCSCETVSDICHAAHRPATSGVTDLAGTAQAAESAQTHLAEPPDIETAGAPSPEGHGLRERLIAIMRALRRPMPPERLVAAIAQDDSSASLPQSQDVLAELGLMELDGVVTCGPEGFRLATGSG